MVILSDLKLVISVQSTFVVLVDAFVNFPTRFAFADLTLGSVASTLNHCISEEPPTLILDGLALEAEDDVDGLEVWIFGSRS